jgi:hypothetical protein
MDVNVITFPADYGIIDGDEHVVAQFDFGPKECLHQAKIFGQPFKTALRARPH